MRKRLFPIIQVLGLVLILGGCATIIKGDSQSISIKTKPANADVRIYDQEGQLLSSSQTPYLATLKTGSGFFGKANYTIIIEKEGYQTQKIEVEGRLSGWYFGNAIFGGLLGILIVDPFTGAMYTLTPEEIDNQLHWGGRGPYSYLQQDEGLLVVLKENVPEFLHSHMNRIN